MIWAMDRSWTSVCNQLRPVAALYCHTDDTDPYKIESCFMPQLFSYFLAWLHLDPREVIHESTDYLDHPFREWVDNPTIVSLKQWKHSLWNNLINKTRLNKAFYQLFKNQFLTFLPKYHFLSKTASFLLYIGTHPQTQNNLITSSRNTAQ